MTESPDAAEPDLATLLSLLGAASDAHVLAALRDAGLPGLRTSHGYVFQLLVTGPATATALAAALGISQQAVSKTLRELLDLGYVRYVDARGDRRRRPVELSESGRRAVEVARGARADLTRRVGDATGPDRLEITRQVLAAASTVLRIDAPIRARRVPPPPDHS